MQRSPNSSNPNCHKVCRTCNKPFIGYGYSVYCSVTCKDDYYKTLTIKRICPLCNLEFTTSYRHPNKYCSKNCSLTDPNRNISEEKINVKLDRLISICTRCGGKFLPTISNTLCHDCASPNSFFTHKYKSIPIFYLQ